MTPFNPKPRPCKQCSTFFVPVRPMQSVCSPRCAAKKVKADKAEERAKVKTRKEAIKTIPQLIKEAQVEFNAYIRSRDMVCSCISCGGSVMDGVHGGSFDAGHYRSTGSASHLRFHEDNCHAQCKKCNRWLAGKAVDYRIGLIKRIGIERVEALEANNTPHKWTREELIEIRNTYKAKRKELESKQ